MPRIGFILQSFYGDQIGGAERQVEILGEALRGKGYETVYICERPPDRPRREHVEGMEVLALPTRKRRSAWLNYSSLKEAMFVSQADIYYQRVRHPYSGLAAFYAVSSDKALVFAAASKADMVRKQDLRWSSHAGNPLDILFHPLNRFLEDQGILKASRIICQTAEQAALLEANYQRSGVIIPNHIRISENQHEGKDTQDKVLWISNIKPFKRPEIFIELARNCTELDVEFVMAGSCPNQNILDSINRAQTELHNFKYIGPVPPDEAQQLIASAALLVNTSEFEGFPNAFQQAWAASVPTISTGIDPDGVIRREKLGETGATIGELTASVRSYLGDRELRKTTGERARQFALKAYDINSLVERYIGLFEELLGR